MKVLYYGTAVVLGAFGAVVAFNGSVSPKDFAGYAIDAQMSAWVYGAIFGMGAEWLAGRARG